MNQPQQRRSVVADGSHAVDELRLLTDPGQVFELRVLDGSYGNGRPQTFFGYWNHEHIQEAVAELAKFTDAKGVYFSMNPCKPALLARAPLKMKIAGKGESTPNHEIIRRTKLVVDCDPARPSNVCSSDEEKQAAENLAGLINFTLSEEHGFPSPFIDDTGNGAALIYLIDLPCDEVTDKLIERFFAKLAAEHGDERVKVDVSLADRAQIIRVPGTINAKGDIDAGTICGRPWRPAKIVSHPANAEVVSREVIEAYAGPEEKPEQPKASSNGAHKTNGKHYDKFDLERWLAEKHVPIGAKEKWENKGGSGHRWVFPVCPFDSGHDNSSAIVMQFASGAIEFMCHHNGCAGVGWRDLRQKYEPGCYDWQNKKNRNYSSASRHKKNGEACPIPDDELTSSKNDEIPDPIPLSDPEPPKLPDGVFDGWLGDFVDAVSYATETPKELPASLALAVLATLAQGKLSVRPEPGYFEPLCLYVASFLPSGQRKTAVLQKFMAPIIEHERGKAAEVGPQIKKLTAIRKAKESQIKSMREKVAKVEFGEGDDLIQRIAQAEADLPDVPVIPRYFVQDITPEHLGTMLDQQNERLAVISDEGGLFETFAGRYSNSVPNLDLLLQGHSGSFVRVDRGSRPPVVLNHPTLTIAVTPQPDVAAGLAAKPGFRGRGLLARWLYTMPKSNLGTRTLNPRPIPDEVEKCYHTYVKALLELPSPTESDRSGPVVLTFSSQAYGAWKQFQHEIEKMMGKDGRLEYLPDVGGKMPGACARLAALLHIADLASSVMDNREISEGAMARAVALSKFFLEHALFVFGIMGADKPLQIARRLWAEIHRRGEMSISARDVWQPLKGAFKTMSEVDPGFEVLIERGWLLDPDDGAGDGKKRRGRPSRRYTVNPKAMAIIENNEAHNGGGIPISGIHTEIKREEERKGLSKAQFSKSSIMPSEGPESVNSPNKPDNSAEPAHAEPNFEDSPQYSNSVPAAVGEEGAL